MDYVYYAIDPSDSLSHHGIKGQKWGVRRFQNKDGTLTAEGYQHWGLNPDGSKFKGKRNRKGYSDATVSSFKKGVAGGAVAGAALGTAAGPLGTLIGMKVGAAAGGAVGTAVGAINTRRMQKKIKNLLDENGKVYVSDL